MQSCPAKILLEAKVVQVLASYHVLFQSQSLHSVEAWSNKRETLHQVLQQTLITCFRLAISCY